MTQRKLSRRQLIAVIGLCFTGLVAAAVVVFALGPRQTGAPPAGLSAAAAPPVETAPAEVMHFWNAGSERVALDLIRDAYVAQGGVWIDNAQTDHAMLRRALIERISTSTQPVAVLWQSNVELRDLAELGVFGDLDAVAKRENWDAVLSPAVRARVQVDGRYYMAPTNIHGNNWIFYNAPLLHRLGVAQPRTWPDLIAALHRLRAAGVRPVAIGPGDWEVQIIFASILAGSLGREDYRALISRQDANVLDKPSVIEAFRIFAQIRTIVSADPPYATWADAARAVAMGEAGFEFMGDWAKAEMARSGAQPGREAGCMLAPGSENAIILTVDGFAFPAPFTPARGAARDALASIVMDRDVQARFAIAKGALAVRTDAPPAHPDPCEAITIARLAEPAAPLAPPNAGLPSAMAGDFQALVSRFYNNPVMTPQQARDGLAAIFR
jgi:glucose/mannose transport system substrate-binding protein